MHERTPTLKPAKDVMPAETAALFAEIKGNPLLNPFILIGGTALSLHIGQKAGTGSTCSSQNKTTSSESPNGRKLSIKPD